MATAPPRVPGVHRLFTRRSWGVYEYHRTLPYMIKNMATSYVDPSEFSFSKVSREAYNTFAAEMARNETTDDLTVAPEDIRNRYKMEDVLHDSEGWMQLCKALENHGGYSKLGSSMMHHKVTNAMAQRMLVDFLSMHADSPIRQEYDYVERILFDQAETARKDFEDDLPNTVECLNGPIFTIGIPRSMGGMLTHTYARTGLVHTPKLCDTRYPGIICDMRREELMKARMRGFYQYHPTMKTVKKQSFDSLGDDTQMQLLSPRSVAWGLFHDLHDHLYTCIQLPREDVVDMYKLMRRTMVLMKAYAVCNTASDFVSQHFHQGSHSKEHIRFGTKEDIGPLEVRPWLMHCPLAILHSDVLVEVFPNCRIMWAHRAVAQNVPSLCSCIAFHHSMYSGRRLSDSELASIGEVVCGLFGSGSNNAVHTFARFPFKRMTHLHNRDLNRSCIRLLLKTSTGFGIGIDEARKTQGINGLVEHQTILRPEHDAQLRFFGLSEGIVGEAFKDYCTQFEEFAYEPKYGLTMQNYKTISNTYQHELFTKPGYGERTNQFGDNANTPGSAMQEMPPPAAHRQGY